MTDPVTSAARPSAEKSDPWAAERRRRRRLLTVLQWTFGAIAVVYLALHATVSVEAYMASGLLAAAATLATLGIGDLWWTVHAWRTGDQPMLAIAGTAAILAFGSWATRRWTNQMLTRLALAEVGDRGIEIERLKQGPDTRENGAPEPRE